MTIKNSTFTMNEATLCGGGLYLGGANYLIEDSIFDSNKAGTSGGGMCINAVAGTITGNTVVSNNTAAGSRVAAYGGVGGGGGIFNSGAETISNPMIIAGNTQIINNHTIGPDNTGGGIYSGHPYNTLAGLIIMDNALISGNTTNAHGGGVHAEDDLIIKGNARIQGNTAGFDGGGVYMDGVLVVDDNATMTGNTAGRNGGGVWIDYLKLDKLTVGAGTVWHGNSAAEYDETVAPVDLPVYEAQVLVSDYAWSAYPAGAPSGVFRRGYNNYDISYTGVKFRVDYDANGGMVTDFASGEKVAQTYDVVYLGDTAVSVLPTRAGYEFLGWYNAGNEWNFVTVVTSDLTLTAEWQEFERCQYNPDIYFDDVNCLPPEVPNTGLFGLSRSATMLLLSVIVVGTVICLVVVTIKIMRRTQ
jgi:uncharacterized repeat protein (TIGR02543 family)